MLAPDSPPAGGSCRSAKQGKRNLPLAAYALSGAILIFYSTKRPDFMSGSFVGGAEGNRTPVRKLTNYPSTDIVRLKIYTD